MEQKIKNRFSINKLNEICILYGIDNEKIEELKGFENFVYEYSMNGEKFILRVAHSFRRSLQMIAAEVDWINFLAEGGATVSKAINSKKGNLVEKVSDGEDVCFLATAFVKASGGIVFGTNRWNPSFFKNYGREIGKLHSLSKSYPTPDSDNKRYEWDDKAMIDLESWLPDSDSEVIEEYQQLKTYIETLSKNQKNYGLIHQDTHGGNFFVDDKEEIIFFDFDDCAYSWYANDIGILLFYALDAKTEIKNYQQKFIESFIAGYNQTNYIEPKWIEYIPSFIRLREITLYGVIHRDFDVKNIDHPWILNFMDGRKEKIINNIPYFDFDFSNVKIN